MLTYTYAYAAGGEPKHVQLLLQYVHFLLPGPTPESESERVEPTPRAQRSLAILLSSVLALFLFLLMNLNTLHYDRLYSLNRKNKRDIFS
jgi:hypothetical protein